jgi:hypothetical protein
VLGLTDAEADGGIVRIRRHAREQLAQLFEGVGVQSFEMWIHGVTSQVERCESDNYSEAATILLSLGMQ